MKRRERKEEERAACQTRKANWPAKSLSNKLQYGSAAEIPAANFGTSKLQLKLKLLKIFSAKALKKETLRKGKEAQLKRQRSMGTSAKNALQLLEKT